MHAVTMSEEDTIHLDTYNLPSTQVMSVEAAHNRVMEVARASDRMQVVDSSTVPTSHANFDEGIDRSSITTNEYNNN